MSDALDRDLEILHKEASSWWELRAPHRAVKALIREHMHYPAAGTEAEAAFLNGASHMLGIIKSREREVRLEHTSEESEGLNMAALNLEIRVLTEMIKEFNKRVKKP